MKRGQVRDDLSYFCLNAYPIIPLCFEGVFSIISDVSF